MSHVLDDLELYVLGALEDETRARVAAHLSECGGCQHAARELARIADALPETVPDREPPARLRERILTSARADAGRSRPRSVRWAWSARPWASVAGLALAAGVALVAVGTPAALVIADARAQAAEMTEIAIRVSQPAQTWYMRATDQWPSSGAMLYAPDDGRAFVVVRDLPAAPSGSVYALWLVDDDGRWIRATNFTPRGWRAELVDLDMGVAGYAQCAVTLEARGEGRRAGPMVLQSNLYEGER